jgi:hypothetical protein
MAKTTTTTAATTTTTATATVTAMPTAATMAAVAAWRSLQADEAARRELSRVHQDRARGSRRGRTVGGGLRSLGRIDAARRRALAS